MFDDLLKELLEDSVWGESPASPKAQRVIRLVFGLLGSALAIAGLVVTVARTGGANPLMRLGFAGVFLGVAWFCAGTVILGRSPRGSAWLLGGSFATAFLARVIGGG